ncbi:MAG TPA: malonyl-ACP O-methyltransferase BioC [Gammaproteobacteria bacterium]|nr:malonyl-ACP O-methyltransferase BioC [Gammaproteobacteria bacterium]
MNPWHDDASALDRVQVRRAFERAARDYDAHAVLQAEVRARLMERLDLVKLGPQRVLDAGCGTGHGAASLARRWRGTRVTALDLAPAMLREARRHRPWFRPVDFVCGTVEALPFADASFDLLFCNLVVQWCNDLDAVFREFRRVLRPHGLLLFSTFGPDTLKELRAAWSEVDGFTHVNRFFDMHDIGDALVRAGFAEPVMDVEHVTLTYGDAYALMRDLKSIGAHNVTAGRPHGLTGKARMRALADAYERFRRDGRLPATYEVVYGTAWAPAEPQGVFARDGAIGLESLRASLRAASRKK